MITNTAFGEMDKNSDGKVTTEEFISACLAHNEFTTLLSQKLINIFIETTEEEQQ